MNMQLSLLEPEPIGRQPISVSNRPPLPPESGLLNWIRQWTLLILLTSLTYLLVSRFVLQTVQVQGQSMVPTLHDEDRYFLNRWIYYFHPPQRGDVVVLKDPSDGDYAVKRIVGLTGDCIYLKSGRIYLNGRELREPYLAPHTVTDTCGNVDEELILCGREQYFVLGDNRPNSFDSRIYGPVPRQNIVGELVR
jgi:signal peptidase I